MSPYRDPTGWSPAQDRQRTANRRRARQAGAAAETPPAPLSVEGQQAAMSRDAARPKEPGAAPDTDVTARKDEQGEYVAEMSPRRTPRLRSSVKALLPRVGLEA